MTHTKLIGYGFYVLLLITGCNEQISNPNRLCFTINPENRNIVIPVHINDSVSANMVFDTGSDLGCFFLDSTFVTNNSVEIGDKPIWVGKGGSLWSNNGSQTIIYKNANKVIVGNTEHLYDYVRIFDWKNHTQTLTDGLLSISKNDREHVWELNFENNYLEIHKADDFMMPANCFVVPFEIDGDDFHSLYIMLPLKVKCANGDTLSLTRKFSLDSGMAWDIMLTNADENEFFNKQENSIWLSYQNDYIQYCNVKATIFDSYKIDSLRIYTNNFSNRISHKYFIGLNFLKRFNVFYDMKNRVLGLQSINNFNRIVNPNYRRFYLSTNITPQGNIIVKEVGNYKDNCYKTAGFLAGDEILRVNGELPKDPLNEELTDDTLVYDIIRDGLPKQIVVHVDKNAKIGD